MSVRLRKVTVASRIAIQHPTELIDRLLSRWEGRRRGGDVGYVGVEWDSFLRQLSSVIGEDALAALEDAAVASLERKLVALTPTIDRGPFGPISTADLLLAKTCYLLCRAIRPECIVETGVAYGVSSSFLLAGLEANGKGVLHSIDLPALAQGSEDYIGAVIPDRLRDRWRLHRGASRRILPKLLPTIDPVDIFFHDSLHTYSSVSQDLSVVMPYLASRAAVVVDDVELHSAFSEWEAQVDPVFSVVVRAVQKRSLFGVAIVQSPGAQTRDAAEA